MNQRVHNPSASFTRPADITAYADGDLVANSTTAGSVAPLAFNVPPDAEISRVRISKSGTGVANSTFRVHLYTASPTVANGDNGAFSSNQAASLLGDFEVVVDRACSDGAVGVGGPRRGSSLRLRKPDERVYALVEAKGAYTPANAEVFTVTLEVAQVT